MHYNYNKQLRARVISESERKTKINPFPPTSPSPNSAVIRRRRIVSPFFVCQYRRAIRSISYLGSSLFPHKSPVFVAIPQMGEPKPKQGELPLPSLFDRARKIHALSSESGADQVLFCRIWCFFCAFVR